MCSLAGKTALVTGAGRGIGRAIALRLARDGARVGVHYGSSADGAAQTVAAITDAGGDAFAIQHGLSRLWDGGRIVNISTRFTHGARNPELAAYAMSKTALDSLTATLAKELGSRGITVNAVGPGATDTDMNAARLSTEESRAAIAVLSPLNRAAQPADIADIVAFLASDYARWVTGQRIDGSGGSML
ncbi:SDR family oxidoreductase [Microtetraspora sp. NBRC 16547]|uniref:SDR family oxidoreductase n=1 Tax=Microtetraspora sp. NBRC 16547 TaxID=3030993 RepID=UPI0024A2F507|nr:SDR family oxidoreductase [Microtetraspora sp. NBRC 16547]GLW98998.1 short-chain dehydrogenase [Microtetraspora sp. NBRC 16547]